MAILAIFMREDPHDYSKLALDFSEMSFDEDKTSVSGDDQSVPSRQVVENQRSNNSWQQQQSSDQDNNTPFRRIIMLFADEKLLALSSVVCCLIGAPIEIVQFIYIGMVVDDCAVPDGPRALGGYVAVLVALYLIEAVSSASQLILTMMVGEKMVVRLRREVFSAILKQDVCYLEGGGGARAQDLCSRLEKDVQRVQEAATLRCCMLLQSLIQILVGTVFLWALSWKLTLIALAILPIIALLMLAQSTVLQSYSKRTVEVLNQVEFLASEVISNMKTVRSMGRENAEKARMGAELLQAYKVARAMGVAHGVADGVGVLVLKGCMVLGILYGGTLVHDGELSGGILISYVFIALQVVMAMSVLPPLVGEMTKALAAGSRVFELLDRRPLVKARGGMTLAGIEGRLELKQVTLYYPYQPDAPALNRVSLTVEAGSHLAVCGAPGSGKTSVLALLQRFLDPQEGLVLLDDTDVSTFDPAWLRQQMALVPQEPILFSCSIADNVAYGQAATPQQIQAAAELVGLHARVAALPDGYRTHVAGGAGAAGGDRGTRIGLARAALRDAPILLLDEPLGRLRGAAREAAARGLRRMAEGRTVVSASRGAGGELAAAADVVAVLSKGGVAELGSHAELLRLGGLYKSLPGAAADPAARAKEGAGAGPRGVRGSRVAELLDEVEALLAEAEAGRGGAAAAAGGASVYEEVRRLRELY
jgi:ABC-type multidrug transport system fused ATPase/permease subunit